MTSGKERSQLEFGLKIVNRIKSQLLAIKAGKDKLEYNRDTGIGFIEVVIKDQTGNPPSESYLHFQLEKGLSEFDAFQKAQLMMARYFEKLKRYET